MKNLFYIINIKKYIKIKNKNLKIKKDYFYLDSLAVYYYLLNIFLSYLNNLKKKIFYKNIINLL
jgi:hypothetical protein